MFIPYGTGLYLCALRAFTSLRSGYENAILPGRKKKNHMGLEEDSSGLGLGKCLDFYTPKPLFVTGQEEILKWQQTYT